jgi:hypothetical protein
MMAMTTSNSISVKARFIYLVPVRSVQAFMTVSPAPSWQRAFIKTKRNRRTKGITKIE